MLYYRYGENGSAIPEMLTKKRVEKYTNARYLSSKLAWERIQKTQNAISERTALRWAGYQAEDEIDNAIMFYNYNFEHAVGPDYIAANVFSTTEEGEGEEEEEEEEEEEGKSIL